MRCSKPRIQPSIQNLGREYQDDRTVLNGRLADHDLLPFFYIDRCVNIDGPAATETSQVQAKIFEVNNLLGSFSRYPRHCGKRILRRTAGLRIVQLRNDCSLLDV